METNLKGLIDNVIGKFRRNRTGPQPKVIVKVPLDLPLIYWHDDGLERFIKSFLYHALQVNIQILVHQRNKLADLESFVGVNPLCWMQLRVEGHGPGMIESTVEEIFDGLGYRCEEWVGVEGSESQLAIFKPTKKSEPRLVLCIDSTKNLWKCDFLVPVSNNLLLPSFPEERKKA
jgi:hypothetical protein